MSLAAAIPAVTSLAVASPASIAVFFSRVARAKSVAADTQGALTKRLDYATAPTGPPRQTKGANPATLFHAKTSAESHGENRVQPQAPEPHSARPLATPPQ